MGRPRVAVVGSYGVGLTFEVADFPASGETVFAPSFRAEHGGKGSNQAVAAARLGADVAFCTVLGDDAYASDAAALWRREGVLAVTRRVPGQSTMAGAVLVEASGENRILVAPGALAAFAPSDVRAFEAEIAASAVCLTQLEVPVEVAREALLIARRHGVMTVLDPAPARSLDDEMLRLVDVLTPNLHEALRLIEDDRLPAREAALALRRRSGGDVVVTLGADGCLIATASGVTHCPAVAASAVVDTTGAGDAFAGALGMRLADGAGLLAAVRFAAAAAARAVARRGVLDGLPYAADMAVHSGGRA